MNINHLHNKLDQQLQDQGFTRLPDDDFVKTIAVLATRGEVQLFGANVVRPGDAKGDNR